MAEQILLNGIPLQGDELLHPREAAAVLGIGPHYLRQLSDEGKVASRRGPMAHRMYLASDVIAFRRERRARRPS